MKCPQCEADVTEQAVYCHRCGARVDDQAQFGFDSARPATTEVEPHPPVAESPPATGGERLRREVSSRRGWVDEPEGELWRGGYSRKAMVGTWVLCGAITLAALVVAALYAPEGWGKFVWLGILVLWVVPAVTYVYRRLNQHYRVTNHQLFHELGIFRRRIDRVELIDVNDITFEQGPVERLLGIGTIHVMSNDHSHPQLDLRGIDDVRTVAQTIDSARRKERVRRGLHIESF